MISSTYHSHIILDVCKSPTFNQELVFLSLLLKYEKKCLKLAQKLIVGAALSLRSFMYHTKACTLYLIYLFKLIKFYKLLNLIKFQ